MASQPQISWIANAATSTAAFRRGRFGDYACCENGLTHTDKRSPIKRTHSCTCIPPTKNCLYARFLFWNRNFIQISTLQKRTDSMNPKAQDFVAGCVVSAFERNSKIPLPSKIRSEKSSFFFWCQNGREKQVFCYTLCFQTHVGFDTWP